jgi:predicted transcriptional regulator
MTTPKKHPLQEALDRIGLSQKRLAKLAGISQSVVCATINQTGGRITFTAGSARKMLPHLVDAKGQPVISLAELIYPPGEAPVAPAARRRGKR